MKATWVKQSLLTIAVLSLTSCSVVRDYDLTPQTLEVNKPNATSANSSQVNANSTNNLNGPRISQGVPQPPVGKQPSTALSFDNVMAMEGEAISMNVASLPLPQFVHEVLSNQLGLSYHLDPRLEDKTDLVTLSIEDPLKPKDLYRTIQTVLQAYGVALRNDEGLVRVEFSPSGRSTEPPILVSGEALPSVPTTHRPVFYLMDLNVVQSQRAVGWLAQAFEGQNAKFSSDPERNAVWLRGSLDVVKQAVEVVKLVDQPLMRGRNSIRIEPRYLGADVLSNRMTEMLQAQGYFASQGRPGAVSLFTIEETNSIIVFANDNEVLDYVKEWALELDQPLKQTKGESVFYYEVKNTSAQDVADAINSLLSQSSLSGTSQGNNNQQSSNSNGSSSQQRKGDLVVDLGRNAILFYGSNTEWVTMLPAIERLDKRPLQVMIEVIVAEVTLNDSFSFGIEWALNNANSSLLGDNTANSISIGSNGLSYFPLSSSGYTRAVLNLLATDKQVSILQTPRIVVKSGEEASINVGNEIPILTQSQTSQEGGAVTQQVQYRKTGNSLSVTPVVYAGGEVDLKISQELSASTADPSSPTTTPSIFTRSVSTTLSIKDGGSVLVGGMIQTNETTDEKKVPFFGDIPFLGHLFTTTGKSTDRTELMVLIAPYVIENNSDAEAVTKAFKEQLTLHPTTENND
ncbi:secretin N-terminal domain-containing protein [Alteromonas sediminis]|nr:secretin N-terminal domain-containing protein [Alteromonas sediminis]